MELPLFRYEYWGRNQRPTRALNTGNSPSENVTKFCLCLLVLVVTIKPGVAQKIREPNWDPDTVRVLYFDDCCSKPHPPSAHFPYHGATVRTLTKADGTYEDEMRDAESLRLLFRVQHRPAAGHAELTMYYPEGSIRLKAQFLEDTAAAPVVFIVPSLRRPLSAYALPDGELQTFYPNGAIRQEAEYRRGQRTRSQCYDFKGRPVDCNINSPVIAPRLPAAVYSGKSFPLVVRMPSANPGHDVQPIVSCKAAFVMSNAGELLALRLLLPRRGINAESAALAKQRGRYPISFGLAANRQGSRGTGSYSSALNQELRFIGIEAGRLFYYDPKQPLKPVLVDGEPVATYFTLPVEFGLKS